MKKFDLYELAVRICGLLLLYALFQQLPYYLSTFAWWSSSDTWRYANNSSMAFLMLSTFLAFFLAVILTFIFIFRARSVCRSIVPYHEHDDIIELSVDKKSIYEIASLLTGFFLIVNTLPELIGRFLNETQAAQASGTDIPDTHNSFLIVGAMKLVCGVLLVLFSAKLASYFSRRQLTHE